MKKKHEKEKCTKMRAPKLRFRPYIGGGLVVFGSERAVVFANLTAPVSAGEEAALLRHLVSVFALGAEAEEDTGDQDDREAHDGSVGFPILRL